MAAFINAQFAICLNGGVIIMLFVLLYFFSPRVRGT